MSNPIDTYDDATSVVFTFGADSFGTWLFFVIAVALFVGFLVRMTQHENHAYDAVVEAAASADGDTTAEPEVAPSS